MTIESILERIAVSLERIAGQGDNILASALSAPAAEEAKQLDWDPLTAPVQSKYGADKRAILEQVAKERGITYGPKDTPAQIHEAILTIVKDDSEQQVKEEPKPEPVKEEPKPKFKLEDLKKAVAEYAGRRVKAGSSDPRSDARALMAQFGNGKAKTDEIDPADYAAVIEAANADWLPEAAEEEL